MAFTKFRVVRGPDTWDHCYCICDEDGNLVRSEGANGKLLHFISGRDEKTPMAKAALELAQAKCDELSGGGAAKIREVMEEKELKDLSFQALRKQAQAERRAKMAAAVAEATHKAELAEIELRQQTQRALNKEITVEPPAADNPVSVIDSESTPPENNTQRRGRPKKKA